MAEGWRQRILATLASFVACLMFKPAAVILLLTSHAVACSVPVFRYALEHWPADPYQVEIQHHGPLSASDQTLVQTLTSAKLTNIAVKTVPVAGSTTRLVVKHPASLSKPAEVWSAPLTSAAVKSLLDSPLRQEIASKLGDGDSAVWVLLESGDPAKDNAAAQMLEQQLARLAETMELPKLDDQDIKNGLVSLPDEGLRLSFPVLRLSRHSEEEQFLVHLLLATEPDLGTVIEPIAFPIFGRGRVLYGLVGKGIKSDNLGRAASFLIGSCSCQIKEQNPGVDLLLTADWKKLMNTNALLDEELPKLSDIEGLKPILVPIPEHREKAFAATAFHIPRPGLLLGVVALAAAVWAARRRSA